MPDAVPNYAPQIALEIYSQQNVAEDMASKPRKRDRDAWNDPDQDAKDFETVPKAVNVQA